MNCFQIIIFVSPETTASRDSSPSRLLWIAFKLLFLCRQKQRINLKTVKSQCCELLSNYYFCVARNNPIGKHNTCHMLWIAFKLLFLYRQKQQRDPVKRMDYRCELLSNYYFCVARNNSIRAKKWHAKSYNAFRK